tara:strand:+ start:8405 stop:9040 length:636 start_codon:yes stop_codon:yes gene_type:complete
MKLFIICVLVSIFIVGCSQASDYKLDVQESIINTPEPIPTPPPLMNSKAVVIEELIVFNELHTSFISFITETQSIYNFEGNAYYKMYIATVVIMEGLNVYQSGLNAWQPTTTNDYFEELSQIKSAELYRISKFKNLGYGLMEELVAGNVEGVEGYTEKFSEWGLHSDNKKPMVIQKTLLDYLDISAEDVNFTYTDKEEINPIEEEKPNTIM